jgi:hypothetical protein
VGVRLLARARAPARFGLVFSWTFYGVLAAFPWARPCGSGWILSRLLQCQLASQRLAPLGVRAERVCMCVGLCFSVQRSTLWVSVSVSLWCSVVLLWLGLYLLCFIYTGNIYPCIVSKKSYLYHTKTISNTMKIFIELLICQFIYVINNFFKYKNRVVNCLLDL